MGIVWNNHDMYVHYPYDLVEFSALDVYLHLHDNNNDII